MRIPSASALALLLAACAQPAEPPSRPARLVQPDGECRTEIAGFVAARSGASVTLSLDSLLVSDRLVLERQSRRDAQGRPLDGRPSAPPLAFVLRQEKAQCVLYEEATGASTLLIQCRCAALAPQ
jgi:hypothetical protein